jgi:hypothetical protein
MDFFSHWLKYAMDGKANQSAPAQLRLRSGSSSLEERPAAGLEDRPSVLRQKSDVFSTSSKALLTRNNLFAERSSKHAESVMILNSASTQPL